MNKQHPQDVGLTYIQHLKFTWEESVRLMCMSVVMIIHGVVPWIWDWRFSAYLDNARERIKYQTKQRAIRKKNNAKKIMSRADKT
jgi:hypothetical protein